MMVGVSEPFGIGVWRGTEVVNGRCVVPPIHQCGGQRVPVLLPSVVSLDMSCDDGSTYSVYGSFVYTVVCGNKKGYNR
jgi:hypothetical protein